MTDLAPLENLSGLVERVTFHNPENGYCVLRLNVRGRRDLLTVVGHASAISAGEFVRAAGTWLNDRNHGMQFKAKFLKVTAPTTKEGIEKYLGSGMIKGIGPVYAKKLVNAFGEAVFEIIENESRRLMTVEGIGRHRCALIIKGWAEQKAIREIMLFLHQYGISTSRAVRIYKTFGDEAISIITQNPYILARKIKGIGFLSADQIAQKIGIPPDSLIRVQAGLNHILLEAMDEGHCGLPTETLLKASQDLLEVSYPLLERGLQAEIIEGELIQDSVQGQEVVFLRGLYQAELLIANRLKDQCQGASPWGSIEVDKAIPWVEERLGLTLASSQKQAIEKTLHSKVMVITGGPGVGKTTLVNSILHILKAKQLNLALCAPTGRAAKRLSESTGLEAKTIHRLLEVNPQAGGFSRNADNPLECNLLVVDEVSMVDVPLMAALLKALPSHAALLLVGDIDQLPSVGPGQVLADIIASGAIPVAQLTEVFRQALQSKIITNAHRVNQGQMPVIPEKGDTSDFYFIEAQEPEDCVQKLLEVVAQRIPQKFKLNPIRDIQVLCPMNRGGVGARSLNMELQRVLNPHQSLKVERFGWTFATGDKVMQIVNNYDKETYNGDIGVIKEINTDANELAIGFEGRDVVYDFGELDEITLAYATTIHKSQGSEYPAVVIPLMTQHYQMLKRNLLYTGMTRGKQLVVIIGQKKALAIAVKDQRSQRRWSKLDEHLAKPTVKSPISLFS
jgi:exodeoxyribonuclease V alpha subunit